MAVCEQCWAEAQRRLYAGDTDGESVTAIYEQLVEAEWCYCENDHDYEVGDEEDGDPKDPTHPGWEP